MEIKEIKKIVSAEIICGEEFLARNIDYAYSCDLMSDVLAFVKHPVLLLTGLTHPQVIRTAEMLDINVILFVRGKGPTTTMIDMAKKDHLVLLKTEHSLFTASGLLYRHGITGEEEAHHEIHL